MVLGHLSSHLLIQYGCSLGFFPCCFFPVCFSLIQATGTLLSVYFGFIKYIAFIKSCIFSKIPVAAAAANNSWI